MTKWRLALVSLRNSRRIPTVQSLQFFSLIHCDHDRYGAGRRQLADDIGSVVPVPGATELHLNSLHRVLRPGLVPTAARHHTSLRAALRALVVSLVSLAWPPYGCLTVYTGVTN